MLVLKGDSHKLFLRLDETGDEVRLVIFEGSDINDARGPVDTFILDAEHGADVDEFYNVIRRLMVKAHSDEPVFFRGRRAA